MKIRQIQMAVQSEDLTGKATGFERDSAKTDTKHEMNMKKTYTSGDRIR